MSIRVFTLVLTTLVLSGFSAPADATEDSHLLRLNLKKYESYSFECEAELSTLARYRTAEDQVDPSVTTMNMYITLRVLDVVMGQATIECTVSDLYVQQKQAPSFQITFVVDPTGRVLSRTSPSDDPMTNLIMSTISPSELLGVPLPIQAVRFGSRWSTPKDDTITVDGATGAVYTSGTLSNTFVAIRDTFGLPCWEISSFTDNVRQRGEITSEGIDLTIEGSGKQSGVTFLDVSTGMLIRQELVMSFKSTTRPTNNDLAEQATLDVITSLRISMLRRAIR